MLKGQNIELLKQYKDSIKTNALLMMAAPDFNQKKIYSDRIESSVIKLIKQEKSIGFKMDSMSLVKVLTSDNKKIRLFTWVVPKSNNTYVFKGIVQTYNKNKKDYRTIKLVDKTKSISRPYSKILSAKKWYGAYYYKII
jgi:ketol-acid reductoisomerase